MQSRDSILVRWFRNVAKRAELWPLVLVPIIITAILVFFEIGYGQAQDVIQVSLDRTSVISPVEIRDSTSSYPKNKSLKAAIAGVLSPGKSLEYYGELLSYLGDHAFFAAVDRP